MCERAIACSLPAYQKSLWEAKMVMMSKCGRNVQGELSRLKEANPVLQARLLSKLARSAKLPSEQVSAIQKILTLLDEKPLEQVDYLVQLAETLFANSCPAKDIQDQLLAAIDNLVDLDQTVDPDEPDGGMAATLGEGSQTSGRSSAIKPSEAGGSRAGGSRAGSQRSGSKVSGSQVRGSSAGIGALPPWLSEALSTTLPGVPQWRWLFLNNQLEDEVGSWNRD